MFSKHGTKAFVCIFVGTSERKIELKQRDGDVHFDFVAGLKSGTRYGFRVEGPWMPELGLRYDPSKLLVDPYSWSLDQPFEYCDELGQRNIDTAAFVPKSIVEVPLADVGRPAYRKPEFIYELPVKAFTKLHPHIPEKKRGTVAALAEPVIVEHLKKIGVDTIELMPITAWIDERHLRKLGLRNAWGYNPVQFFAPDPRLAPGGLQEVRNTIATLHAQGFRVILDVVLNHTGESDQFGPTLCMRGLDSATYYAHSRGELINDAGCGNTLNLNQPHVVEMVVAALRHWVLKAGVDGFRFDLATVMGRMPDGFHRDAPLIKAIEDDAVLSTCIMIAEPWDIGPGGYQLGNFPPRWHEWNDKFRDDVRRFWRGDDYSANTMATRITGSSDVFQNASRSINFISAHDGFTLHDVVTYSDKNNLNNGEQNRDGKSHEVTWVGGKVEALLASLLLSRGIPMLTAGDEFGRTQIGNNNAYAQDNEVTWLDWASKDDALISEVARLVQLRRSHPYFKSETDISKSEWFDEAGEPMNWSNAKQRCVRVRFQDLELVFNSNTKNVEVKKVKIAAKAKVKSTALA